MSGIEARIDFYSNDHPCGCVSTEFLRTDWHGILFNLLPVVMAAEIRDVQLGFISIQISS